MTHTFNKESLTCLDAQSLLYAESQRNAVSTSLGNMPEMRSGSEELAGPKKSRGLKELYQNYWEDLCGFFRHRLTGSSYDYEDAIQNAFIKYSEMDNADQVNNPRAYLYQLVRNNYIDQHRRQQLENAFVESETHTLSQSHVGPESTLNNQRQIDLLEESVEQLSEQQKTILVMHRIDGKTYVEIAEHLDCSVAHVCRQLNKSLVALSTHMMLAGGENE